MPAVSRAGAPPKAVGLKCRQRKHRLLGHGTVVALALQLVRVYCMHATRLACLLDVCNASTTCPASAIQSLYSGPGKASRSDPIVGRARDCPPIQTFRSIFWVYLVPLRRGLCVTSGCVEFRCHRAAIDQTLGPAASSQQVDDFSTIAGLSTRFSGFGTAGALPDTLDVLDLAGCGRRDVLGLGRLLT